MFYVKSFSASSSKQKKSSYFNVQSSYKSINRSRTKRSYAVKFKRNNRPQTVRVRREVILSAGAIGSPQLLMLSGVGEKNHLTSFNIPVIKDLKVGYNLQDHIGLGGLTFIIDDPITFTKSRYQTFSVAMEYIMNERGPMTSLGGVEGLAFVNTKYAPHLVNGQIFNFILPQVVLIPMANK